jgi:hypothetical protein
MSDVLTISDANQPAFRIGADGVPIFNTFLTEQLVTAKAAQGQHILEMPESCAYGQAGTIARAICGSSIGWSYLTVLSYAAGIGVRCSDPELATNLFVASIAPPESGKSRTQGRGKHLLPRVKEHMLLTDPASHQGIAQDILSLSPEPADTPKGKKPVPATTEPAPSVVYILDELNNTLDACNTPGSGRRLAGTLCTLFYQENAGSSDKKGRHVIHAKISICGNIPAKDAAGFRKSFGSATVSGLYSRFLFAPLPPKFDWNEQWHETAVPVRFFDDPMEDTYDDASIVPSMMLSFIHPVRIPASIKDQMVAWRKTPSPVQSIDDEDSTPRGRLAELALRVAVISAAVNGDGEVTPECMAAALSLMEWQERVRKVYSPAEDDDKASQCWAEIEEKLTAMQEDRSDKYYFRWRDLERKFHWGRKYASVLRNVKATMVDSDVLKYEQCGLNPKTGEPTFDKNKVRLEKH